MLQKAKRIGLALGSGAFKGLAHIGVLKALRQRGIQVDMVAGSSMGAIVGGAFCAGMSPEALESIVLSVNEKEYYDWTVPRMGLMRGEKAQKLIAQITGEMCIEEFSIPFAAVACDIRTGEAVVYRTGKAHEAIRGSISIPGVFVPHEYEGRLLVDGEVVDRVPISAVKDMGADAVIAVDVGYRGGPLSANNVVEVLMNVVEVSVWQRMRKEIMDADIQIVPRLSDLNVRTLADAKQIIQRGYEAAMEANLDEFIQL